MRVRTVYAIRHNKTGRIYIGSSERVKWRINISNANQQYNSAYANALSDYLNYQNQLEQNLANSIVGSYGNMVNSLGSLDSGYTNALYDLLQKQAAYEYQNTKNTLGMDKVSTDSINNMGSTAKNPY